MSAEDPGEPGSADTAHVDGFHRKEDGGRGRRPPDLPVERLLRDRGRLQSRTHEDADGVQRERQEGAEPALSVGKQQHYFTATLQVHPQGTLAIPHQIRK